MISTAIIVTCSAFIISTVARNVWKGICDFF